MKTHPSYFAGWKYQCQSFESNGESVAMLAVDGWFLKVSDQLKFKCFNELATVRFLPDL